MVDKTSFRLVSAAMLSAAIVLAGMLLYLSNDLPDKTTVALDYPAAGFTFAFGSGYPSQDRMVVDGFASGYALLSSGPVDIEADKLQVLNYTWIPSGKPGESAFFWRQKGAADNVIKTEMTASGTRLIDLSAEAGWQGEIIEFGFLLDGQDDAPVEIGQVSFSPAGLGNRLRLMWQAWTTFEQRSQQSINFLQGGDHRQQIPLPLLLLAWLLTAMLLLKLLPEGSNARSLLVSGAVFFLAAWMLLDIRWTINSYKQVRVSLQTRANNDLDAEIYQYVLRLKSTVLGNEPARILVIGDENALDYYLLRAKYHLLPHSVDVAGRFSEKLSPESLNFVIFFGQPGEIAKVPGWSAAWRSALVEVDKGDWGIVYKVLQGPADLTAPELVTTGDY